MIQCCRAAPLGRLGASLLLALPLVLASSNTAADCPKAVVAPPHSAASGPHALPLKEFRRLVNRPNAKLEGNVVETEGYLVRALAIKPVVSRCRPNPERGYRLWLATRNPATLKGRASRYRAIVAVVPAAVVEAQWGANPALEALVGQRIRIVGAMTFNATRRSELMKSRGSLWELHAVSSLIPCTGTSCPPASERAH